MKESREVPIPEEQIRKMFESIGNYVILRNPDIWSNLKRGGDIDVLIDNIEGLDLVVRQHLGNPLMVSKRSYVIGYVYRWGKIDFLPRIEWRGAEYLPKEWVFRDSVQSTSFELRCPSASHEAITSWFSSLLWGGFFKQRYREQIIQAAREEPELFKNVLVYSCGSRYGLRLWEAAYSGTPDKSARWYGAIRRRVWLNSFIRKPYRTICGWLLFWLLEFQLRIKPPAPWIVILGPDGSGKSTVLEHLRRRLDGTFTGVKIYHWRPNFFGKKKRTTIVVSDPHGKPPRSTIGSVVKLFYLLFDWVFGYWLRIVHDLARGNLILFDRHFVDLLVDPLRYRFSGPRWLVAFIYKLLPKPDLIVFLDAPAQVIQERKSEVPIEETQRQLDSYREIVLNLPNGVRIDASRPIDDVVISLEDFILCHSQQRHCSTSKTSN